MARIFVTPVLDTDVDSPGLFKGAEKIKLRLSRVHCQNYEDRTKRGRLGMIQLTPSTVVAVLDNLAIRPDPAPSWVCLTAAAGATRLGAALLVVAERSRGLPRVALALVGLSARVGAFARQILTTRCRRADDRPAALSMWAANFPKYGPELIEPRSVCEALFFEGFAS
jgi:hypothetical protein